MKAKQLRSGPTFVTDFDPKCFCGNYATHFVSMHAVDYCTPEEPTRDTFKCNICLAKMYELAHELIEGGCFCASCYLTFDSLCSIIVTLYPLITKEGGCA